MVTEEKFSEIERVFLTEISRGTKILTTPLNVPLAPVTADSVYHKYGYLHCHAHYVMEHSEAVKEALKEYKKLKREINKMAKPYYFSGPLTWEEAFKN